MNPELGREVTRAIRRARVTTPTLVKRTGLGESWIKQVRSGRIRKPRPDWLTKLAEEVGADPAEWLALSNQLGAAADYREATSDQSALIATLERFTGVITDALERVAPPRLAVQPATVIPSRDRKTRRVHWLGIAMTRRGWTNQDQAAKALARDVAIVRKWLNGTTVPRGAELTNLARVFDIPEALILDPPATDAERLARWHFGDDESQLRQAM